MRTTHLACLSLVLSACGGPDPIAGQWGTPSGIFELTLDSDVSGTAKYLPESGDWIPYVVAGSNEGGWYELDFEAQTRAEDPFTRLVCDLNDAADTLHCDPYTATRELYPYDLSRIGPPPGSSSSGEGSSCVGTASPCAGFGRTSCESSEGCYWSPDWGGGVGAGDCDGSPKSCSRYRDEDGCEDQPGCSWK